MKLKQIKVEKWFKIPGFYELKRKLKYWKEKYKEGISKLQSEIKKHIATIDKLSENIKEIKSDDYFYNLWYKEREKRIKILKENSELLDKINILNDKLIKKKKSEGIGRKE